MHIIKADVQTVKIEWTIIRIIADFVEKNSTESVTHAKKEPLNIFSIVSSVGRRRIYFTSVVPAPISWMIPPLTLSGVNPCSSKIREAETLLLPVLQ